MIAHHHQPATTDRQLALFDLADDPEPTGWPPMHLRLPPDDVLYSFEPATGDEGDPPLQGSSGAGARWAVSSAPSARLAVHPVRRAKSAVE